MANIDGETHMVSENKVVDVSLAKQKLFVKHRIGGLGMKSLEERQGLAKTI
jgi:hypothetical protein